MVKPSEVYNGIPIPVNRDSETASNHRFVTISSAILTDCWREGEIYTCSCIISKYYVCVYLIIWHSHALCITNGNKYLIYMLCIIWYRFPYCWHFCRRNHRSPVVSLPKGSFIKCFNISILWVWRTVEEKIKSVITDAYGMLLYSPHVLYHQHHSPIRVASF